MEFVRKWKKPLNISKNRFFYKQILEFHCPSKILCLASNLWNFVKITGPLSAWTLGYDSCFKETVSRDSRDDFFYEEPYVPSYNIFVFIFEEICSTILEGFFMNKLLLYVAVSGFTVLTVWNLQDIADIGSSSVYITSSEKLVAGDVVASAASNFFARN